MPAPHRKTSRADQRKKRRRRRQEQSPEGEQPSGGRTPVTRPVQLSSRPAPSPRVTSGVTTLDREDEYRLTRQDLWRLAIYSAICLVLMIAVLFLVEG